MVAFALFYASVLSVCPHFVLGHLDRTKSFSAQHENPLRFSVILRKDETGQWRRDVRAEIFTTNSKDSLAVDIVHKATPYGNMIRHQLSGTIRDLSDQMYSSTQDATLDGETVPEKIVFHRRHGIDIELNENRTTARLLWSTVSTPVMTHRTLMDNEMFQVQFSYGHIIGVTTHSPKYFVFRESMTRVRSGTWLWQTKAGKIMYCGVDSRRYKAINMDKENNVFGVMRTSDGTLHFFHNGNDLGEAEYNVEGPIYAFVELKGYSYVSIVYE